MQAGKADKQPPTHATGDTAHAAINLCKAGIGTEHLGDNVSGRICYKMQLATRTSCSAA
jgi:hypothetical protein